MAIDRQRASELLEEAMSATDTRGFDDEFLSDIRNLAEVMRQVLVRHLPTLGSTVVDEGAAIEIDAGSRRRGRIGMTSLLEQLELAAADRRKKVIEMRIVSLSDVLDKLLSDDLHDHVPDRNSFVPLVVGDESYRVMLRSVGYKSGDDDPYVSWKMFDGVRGLLSENGPNNLMHLFAGNLPALGIDADEARLLALRNLKRLYAKERYRFDYSESIFEVGGMDGLASSLLFIPDFWEKQYKGLGEDIVIHLVSRDRLVFFRHSDRALVDLTGMMVALGEIGILIPGKLFEFRGGKIAVYHPDGVPRSH